MMRTILISLSSLALLATPQVARCQSNPGVFRPNGDGTMTGTWATGGSSDTSTFWGNLDDDPDAHDGDATYVDGPNKGNNTIWLALSGLPVYFDGALTVEIYAQHQEIGSGDDRIALRYRVVDGNGSTTGITDWTGPTTLTDNGGAYESGTYPLLGISGINTGASWGDAYIAIEQTYTKTLGGDTTSRARTTALEVNVTFTPSVRYWVGTQDFGDGTWNDPLCWATSSGGTGGAGVPTTTQWAVFDGGCLDDALIDADVDVGGINIQSTYPPASTITQSSDVTVTITRGGYSQDGGTFAGSYSAIDVAGDFSLTGGAFTSTSGILTIGGSFTQTGGIFTHNGGQLTMAASASSTLSAIHSFHDLRIGGSLPTTGLLAHYPLDGNGDDASGNGNHAAPQNFDGDEWVSGRIGTGAVDLDGVNDFLKTADTTTLLLSADYTIALWLYADATQGLWSGVYNKTRPAGGLNHWNLQFGNTATNLYVYHDAGLWTSGITIGDISGGWHHVAIRRSGTAMTSYLDGATVASSALATNPVADPGHLNIGCESNGVDGVFGGRVDELLVYNRALDPSEMAMLAGPGEVTLGSDIAVDGDLTIYAATLDAGSPGYDINVGGNWANSGEFVPASGLVTLDGVSGTISSGTSSFGNLTVPTGSTYTALDDLAVTADLTVDGALILDRALSFSSEISFQDGVSPTASYDGTRDCSNSATSPTVNNGNTIEFWVMGDTDTNCAFIKWDVGTIPATANVESATIVLQRSTSGSADDYYFYECKRDWVEGNGSMGSGLDFNTFDGTTPWESGGGLGANDKGSLVLGTVVAPSGVEIVDLNADGVAVVQNWVGGPNNFGMILYNGATTDNACLVSRQNTVVATRPKLIVTYAGSFTGTGTFDFAGSAAQAIPALPGGASYPTLLISNTNTNGASLGGSVNAIDVTVVAGGKLDGASGTLSVSGDFTNDATFTAGTSTVVFNGTTSLGGSATTTFNNLMVTSNGTVTLAASATVDTAFAIDSGSTLTVQSDEMLTVNASSTVNGALTLQARGTLALADSVALSLSGTSTFTASGTAGNDAVVTSAGYCDVTLAGTVAASYVQFEKLSASGLVLSGSGAAASLANVAFRTNAGGSNSTHMAITGAAWDGEVFDGFSFDGTGATDPEFAVEMSATGNVSLTSYDTGASRIYGDTYDNELVGTVTWSGGNSIPTAVANGPYAIDEGQDVLLDAAGSSDPDTDPLTYAWDLDNDAAYDDATGVNPTVVWSTLAGLGLNTDGTANTIVLEVDDGRGGTDTASTTLTINNLAPTAVGGGPYTINEGQDAALDASASTDPGGDTLSYAWDLDNDAAYDDAVGATPTVTWATLVTLGLATDGTANTIGVQVTDADGSLDTASTTLTISNLAPTAAHGGPYAINEGQDASLDASASTDPGGDALTYAWDLDNDAAYDDATGATPTVPWATLVTLGLATDGTANTIGVQVTDADGLSATASSTLAISPGIAAPAITSLTADDPDDGDSTYGIGDTITLTFDAATNQSTAVVLPSANAATMGLYFSLGADSWGDSADTYDVRWSDALTLVITVESVNAADLTIGSTTLTLLAAANVLDSTGASPASTDTSGALAGDWGQAPVPAIISATASDPANDDSILDDGDVLSFVFDIDTNRPVVATTAEIDGLIAFDNPLGTEYAGLWSDARTLLITIQDATGGALAVGDALTLIADGTDDLLDASGTSAASADSAIVTGDWGTTPSDRLAFAAQPADTEFTQPMAAVEVEVLFPSGVRDASFTGPITIDIGTDPNAPEDTSVLSGTPTVDAVAGVATFTDLSIDLWADGFTLVATSGALTPATSDIFDIMPLPPTITSVTALPDPAEVFSTVTIDVLVANGSSPITVSIDFGDGSLTYVEATTGVSVSVDHTYDTAATYSIDVSVDDIKNRTDTDSASVEILADLAAPTITVDLPADSSDTYDSQVSIIGTADEPMQQITVDGHAATIAPDGLSWYATVPLPDYTGYTLPVMGQDLAGNWSTPFDFHVDRLATPIAITLTEPSSNTIIINTAAVFDANVTGGVPPYTYEWDFGDLSLVDTTFPTTHQYAGLGFYLVELTVQDSSSNTGTETVVLDLNIVPPELIASFHHLPVGPTASERVTFDASTSSGDVRYYFWNWNAHEDSTYDQFSGSPTVTHVFDEFGLHQVELKIVDVYGQEDAASLYVPVSANGVAAVLSADTTSMSFRARPGMNLTIPKAITLTNSGPLGSVAAVIADTSAFPEYLRVVPGTIALPSGASGQMLVVLDASLAPHGVEEHRVITLEIIAYGSTSSVDVEIDVDLDPYGGGGGCAAESGQPSARELAITLLAICTLARGIRRRIIVMMSA